VFEADMTHFDLERTFDGAVCPINTLLHLGPAELERHLRRMAQHLERRARYLVQVGLVESDQEPFAGSHWEASRGETGLRVDWVDEELDLVSGVSRQRSRIEVLSGPRAGEVVEELHDMTAWTPATWPAAIAASPFDEVATYDGGTKGQWPRVDATATGGTSSRSSRQSKHVPKGWGQTLAVRDARLRGTSHAKDSVKRRVAVP
jgi:hypothetical protein